MTKKNSTIYRDIVYFNGEKISSLLAQLNKGLIESRLSTETSTHNAEAKVSTGKILEIIGFPISGDGRYLYTKSNGLQEQKTIHDYALTEILNTLPYKDATNLSRDTLKQKDDRTFVLVKGKFSIYDYANLSDILRKINVIDELFGNDPNDNNQRIEEFSTFVEVAYDGLITVELCNKKDTNFIGAIEEKYLRETVRNMLYKYGSTPRGDWEMLCQITNIPENNKGSMQELFSDFGNSIDTSKLSTEKSMGNFINQIVTEFSKVNDLFASVSYPNIAVEPIAVFKPIELK